MADTSDMQYQLVSLSFNFLLLLSFLVATCVLVGLMVLTNRLFKKKNPWLRLGLFFVEAVLVSLAIMNLTVKPQISYLQINDLEVIEVENKLVMLSFVTQQPELVNLLQKVNFLTLKQIMPTNTFQPQKRHNFLLDIRQPKTKIIFENDGQKYYLNWRPLIIKY